MNKLRVMTESDRMGFQGAEDFADGTTPLIGEIESEQVLVTVACVDGEVSIQVMLPCVNDYGDVYATYEKRGEVKEISVAIGEMILNMEPTKITGDLLRSFGFDRIC